MPAETGICGSCTKHEPVWQAEFPATDLGQEREGKKVCGRVVIICEKAAAA
jgi:hypothetical protein